jgi:midasin (ATPase involved in ribosome maturation)
MPGQMLLGSYVCTEVPGQFRYQEGVVTQAVKAGRSVI